MIGRPLKLMTVRILADVRSTDRWPLVLARTRRYHGIACSLHFDALVALVMCFRLAALLAKTIFSCATWRNLHHTLTVRAGIPLEHCRLAFAKFSRLLRSEIL